METEQEVVALIHKQLTQQLTPAEEARLEEWLGNNDERRQFYEEVSLDERRQFYEEVSLSWRLARTESPAVEAQELVGQFERLQQRIRNSEEQIPVGYFRNQQLWRNLAGLLLLITAGWFLYQWYNPSLIEAPVTAFTSLKTEEQVQEVLLPDSSLLFSRGPVDFFFRQSEQQRSLTFSGLAFFEIASEEGRPFLISLEEAVTVKVLGTSFLVKAIQGEPLEVGVESGRVEVVYGNQSFLLGKGEKWQLGPDKRPDVQLINDPNYLSWKNKKLRFKNTPLKEVLPVLERHYGIKVSVLTPEVLNCRFTGSFEDIPLEELLEIISYSLRLSVERVGEGEFSIRGASCN